VAQKWHKTPEKWHKSGTKVAQNSGKVAEKWLIFLSSLNPV